MVLKNVLCLTLFSIASMAPYCCWSADIYTCTDRGKTTLQDHPCAEAESSALTSAQSPTSAPSPASAPAAAPIAAQSVYGEWRGTVQTHGSAGGKSLSGEHALAAIAVALSPDGSFKGVASELGCHFLGLSSVPAGIPGTLRLDVTASDCKVAEFNARYQGHLILQPRNTALFQLNAVYAPSVAVTVATEIKGTLGR